MHSKAVLFCFVFFKNCRANRLGFIWTWWYLGVGGGGGEGARC